MCVLCDRPDLTPEDVLADVRERIARKRFTTISVEGSRCSPEFSYTVGLTAHGMPELVVLGQRPETAVRLVSLWGDYLLDESAVLPGERLQCGPWLLEAVEVAQPRDVLRVADCLYGECVRGLQLVWADAAGRWPWERGHRARRAGQHLLGERAPYYCPQHAPRLDVPPHL